MDAVNVHMLLQCATDDDIFYPCLPRLRRERKYEYLNRSPKPKIKEFRIIAMEKTPPPFLHHIKVFIYSFDPFSCPPNPIINSILSHSH